MFCAGLEAQAYPARVRSACGLKAASQALGEWAGPLYATVGAAVRASLEARYFRGKESILEAYGALCVAAQAQVEAEAAGREGCVAILLREAGEKRRVYRASALGCLTKVLAAFHGVDVFREVKALLDAIATLVMESLVTKEDYDSDEKSLTPEAMLDTALLCLAAAYKAAPEPARGGGHTLALFETLTVFLGEKAVSSVRHGALRALQAVA